MPLLTLAEAASFLRKSKSWLYQNQTIPRHRPPGCRTYLFDQEELLAWVKSGELTGGLQAFNNTRPDAAGTDLDRPRSPVYHRNPLYK